jgi:hypothetical protein
VRLSRVNFDTFKGVNIMKHLLLILIAILPISAYLICHKYTDISDYNLFISMFLTQIATIPLIEYITDKE